MFELVELKDICNISSGGTPSRKENSYYGGNIKWAKISDLETAGDGFIYDTEEKITNEGLENIRNRIFEIDTLFLAMYGSVGKTAITKARMSCNQAILGITTKNDNSLDLGYLKYWFDSTKEKLLDSARGVALKNLSAGMVKALKIPLPPLETQKHIAQILDDAAALRDKTQQLLDEYDQLAQSIFLDMFGDPVTNPKGWEKEKLSKIAPFGKYDGIIKHNNGNYWLLNLDMIEQQTGRIIEKKFVLENEINASTISFSQNQVLYSKLRPYLNKVLIPDGTGYGTSELVPLNPLKDIIDKFFLANLLRSQSFVNYINIKTAGAKMPRVSMNTLRSFNTILPPIQLQNQFADKITLIEQQKALAKQELQECEDLFHCLLQRGFKGELV